ncbi:MAG: hypothetical protein R3301_18105 [Saprospiraceae bacterium]|nr:hypothetical protein [Saprospiraceae bacterium]
MASVYQPIDGYRLWYYGKNDHHLYIQVYHNSQYVGALTFREGDLPDNELDAHGHIRLSFHKTDYPHIVDLLRHKRPLFVWINAANRIGGLATDSTEPVGEAEA